MQLYLSAGSAVPIDQCTRDRPRDAVLRFDRCARDTSLCTEGTRFLAPNQDIVLSHCTASPTTRIRFGCENGENHKSLQTLTPCTPP